jgi:hypothetical protein
MERVTMKLSSWLCTSVGLAPLLVGVAHGSGTGTAGAGAVSVQARTMQGVPATDSELLRVMGAIDWAALSDAQVSSTSARLGANAALLDGAFQALRQAQGDKKFALSQVIAAAPSHHVLATALQWAGETSDDDRRADGWLLLRHLRAPQAVPLAIERMASERHERALESVIWCVRRDAVPPPALEARVVRQLHRLSAHASPRVRSASIQTLADWDRHGRYLMRSILRLLGDPDADVRIATIGASSIQGQTTEPLRAALLKMAADTREDVEVRNVALMNLERFGFTRRQYDVYQAAKADLFKNEETR